MPTRTPITYEPLADPYANLRAGIDRPLQQLRARTERRRGTLPRLRSQFHRINIRCFYGKLPEPDFEVSDDGLRGDVAAICRYSPPEAWTKPFTIRFAPRYEDDPKALAKLLRHEVAHLAGFAVPDWYEAEPHGARFHAIHAAIKRGVPYEGEGRKVDAPAAGRSRSGGPVTMRRGEAAEVVSRVTATFTRPTRGGRENLYVLRGQKVDADHWAVAHSPASFGKVPA